MDKDSIWTKISALVEPLGVELFEIEMPGAKQGFLRVFITRKQEAKSPGKGISVDISDCAKVSKLILNHPDVEEMLPGDCQLEVSSPGINRKLSRSEHFRQALGERVRIVVRKEGQKKEVVRGVLLSFDGKQIEIDDELKKTRQLLDFNSISEARIDFNF